MVNKLKLITLVCVALLFLTGCRSETEQKEYEEKQKILQTVEDSYLPKNYIAIETTISDDNSVIQVITDNRYKDENIPNLISHLNKLKQDNIIKNFDVDTYQIGTKYANDKIVIIIEK